MQALLAARQRESTEAFKETYRHRAGIEGTHSQGTRTMGLRRSRYFGLRKTHLGHIAIAAAINITQLMCWFRGDAPAQTRTSPFKKLMQPQHRMSFFDFAGWKLKGAMLSTNWAEC
jgi:Transposase DDE domain